MQQMLLRHDTNFGKNQLLHIRTEINNENNYATALLVLFINIISTNRTNYLQYSSIKGTY